MLTRTTFLGLAALGALALPGAGQSDSFDTPTLAPQWFWIREDPTHWSLTARPGYLRITTQQGDLAGTLYANARNLLLQPTQPGDWVLDTHLLVQPATDYQQGGLIAYGNDDNYVKLTRSFVKKDGGGVVELISETAGTMAFLSLRNPATEIYLRLTKTGTTYLGEYSFTGKKGQWFTLGTAKHAMSTPKIGLLAINGPLNGVPEIPVDFDYFQASGDGIGAAAPNVVGTPGIGKMVFVDVAAEPDAPYLMAASFGTKPGMPLGKRTLPLNIDPLLVITVNQQAPAIFVHFQGYLNARGEGRGWILIPADAGLVGQTFYLAFITYDAGQPLGVGTISNAAKVTITR